MPTQNLEFVYIPDRIIKKIKDAQNLGEYYFDGIKEFRNDVLKANSITCNPHGNFKWFIPNSKELIIYVNRFILNEPNSLNDICNLNFITMYGEGATAAHDGGHGIGIDAEDKHPRQKGSHLNGEDATHGKEGEEGKSYDMPTLYIFYEELILNKAIGGVNKGLRINGKGLKGGNGGRGGKGGNGGNGADGEDGTSTLIDPCHAGPGVGMSGGNAGSGGKGGKGGKGGDGLNIFLLGPVNKSEYFEINQSGSIQGNPGPAGFDGIPGKIGSWGDKGYCPTYPYVSQIITDGHIVPNPLKSDGDKNIDGKDGLTYYSNDYNKFTAIYNDKIELKNEDLKNVKYITLDDLSKNDGFKKLLPFDFEDVLIQLEDFYSFRKLPLDKQITFNKFKYQLENILISINEQKLNSKKGKFKFRIQRELPIGEKFYYNNYFKIIAELDIESETITEIFESYYSIFDDKKISISNYSKFLFNSEFYSIEKNILGHRLEKFLKEKLKY